MIEMTGIAFRVNDHEDGSLAVAIPELEVWANTYTYPINTMVANLAAHRGEDQVLVFSGRNVPFSGSNSDPLDAFSVAIDFQTPFYFDRGAGSLVLEFRSSGAGSGDRGFLDSTSSHPLLRYVTESTVGPAGHIAQLTYNPIPEPSAAGIFVGCGTILFLFHAFIRRIR